MVVTVDLDNDADIHPPNKIDVGERLARLPLAQVYGRDVPVSGPQYDSCIVREGSIIVKFKHAGGGLITGGHTQPGHFVKTDKAEIHGFELAGSDNQWHRAQAVIEGQTVIVTSTKVKEPLAVRYACHPHAPKGEPWNLYNDARLPASPFCSDWDRMPYDPARNPMPK